MDYSPQVRLRSQFIVDGLSDGMVAALVRRGDWRRVRRGAYVPPESCSPEAAHRTLVEATVALQRTPAVVSHGSAAVLHGLPVDRRTLNTVHLVRSGIRRSDRRGSVWRHWEPEVSSTEIDGVSVTPFADTVLDLARTTPFRDGVAVVDAGLRRGLDRDDLMARLVAAPGRRGNGAARRAVLFGDARSESPGESHSRALMAELGLPTPDLQRIFVVDGATLRTDFVWDEARTVGEFDGKVKYGRLLKPGQRVEDVIEAERAREELLRREHQWVIRWTWDHLQRPEVFRRIITQGLSYHRR